MRWQLLLLSLATVAALWIGTAKWKDRLRASSDFGHDERGWSLVLPNESTSGLETWSRHGGVTMLTGTESLSAQNGFDVSADLSLVAVTEPDTGTGAGSQLRVIERANRTNPRTWVDGNGTGFACPLFTPDGKTLLFGHTTTPNYSMYGGSTARGTFEAIDVPAGTALHADTGRAVIAGEIQFDDCPELSKDGTRIAWLGTDLSVHVGSVAATNIQPVGQPIAGSDFELAPDGTWLALNDGGRLAKVDIASGAKTQLAPLVIQRVLSVSPDGTWVIVQGSGSYGSLVYTAIRVRDGAPVTLSVPGPSYYYGYGGQRRPWIASAGIAKPTPTPGVNLKGLR
jgi:hypothetical protein